MAIKENLIDIRMRNPQLGIGNFEGKEIGPPMKEKAECCRSFKTHMKVLCLKASKKEYSPIVM